MVGTACVFIVADVITDSKDHLPGIVAEHFACSVEGVLVIGVPLPGSMLAMPQDSDNGVALT